MTTYQILDTGKSATDSKALSARINSYSKFATAEINSILDTELAHFNSQKELNILDLGCGTGKQSKHLSKLFPNSKIWSIDISNDSIASLQSENFNNINPKCASFDSLEVREILETNKFDIVVSFYAIYYSANIQEIVERIHSSLNKDAKCVLVGFSKDNNKEIIELSKENNIATDNFSSLKICDNLTDITSLKSYDFENKMIFKSSEDFQTYYQNYGLYNESIELEVISQYFARDSFFTWTKSSKIITWSKSRNPSQNSFSDVSELSYFSIEKYQNFLKEILKQNRVIVNFENFFDQPNTKKLLLRHDVDFNISDAHKMAKIESELGIKSTYFILISGNMYNPFSSKNIKLIKDIVSMGHEIGIHYDEPLNEAVSLLEHIIGKPVRAASQHNPTINGTISSGKKLIDAYDKRIFEEFNFTYVSDSGKQWREHNLDSSLGINNLYLLIHPESWFSPSLDIIQMINKYENIENSQITKVYSEFKYENTEYARKRNQTK
ncbi:methyltransferase domain-containing protein [Fibrobacterales bacterium]|nr:methyltransferase domain-containing protein [Fibrobacterales bacterium]